MIDLKLRIYIVGIRYTNEVLYKDGQGVVTALQAQVDSLRNFGKVHMLSNMPNKLGEARHDLKGEK